MALYTLYLRRDQARIWICSQN